MQLIPKDLRPEFFRDFEGFRKAYPNLETRHYPTASGQDIVYYGEMQHGYAHGLGYKHDPVAGWQYLGYWAWGLSQGYGYIEYTDGELYEGFWNNDYRHGYGYTKLNDGTIYEGEWSRGYYEGMGTIRSGANDYYIGQFVEDQRTGKGCYYYPEGSVYRGEFLRDECAGFGEFTDADKNVYIGMFAKNTQNGFGIQHFHSGGYDRGFFIDNKVYLHAESIEEDGSTYRGMFFANCRHGYGHYTKPDGTAQEGWWFFDIFLTPQPEAPAPALLGLSPETLEAADIDRFEQHLRAALHGQEPRQTRYKEGSYIGQYCNEYRHGWGLWHADDGSRVILGQWVWGELLGVGLVRYAGGALYRGELVQLLACGQGTLFDAEGRAVRQGSFWQDQLHGFGISREYSDYSPGSYVGQFVNGEYTGVGALDTKNEALRLGNWESGNFSGEGICVYQDGQRYEGWLCRSDLNSYGILTQPDGTRYEGDFFIAKKSGFGTETAPNGEVRSGLFFHNAFHDVFQVRLPDGQTRTEEYRFGNLHTPRP